jgi:mannitol/fructose-specific phosphotransferase system IIA component (Ntr-type)
MTALGNHIRSLPILELQSRTRDEAIDEILADMVDRNTLDPKWVASCRRGISLRDELGSTNVGFYSHPHVRVPPDATQGKMIVRIGRSSAGIEWPTPIEHIEDTVHLVFMIIAPGNQHGDLLRLQEHGNRVFGNEDNYPTLLTCDSDQMADLIDRYYL